jgi:hypothetical protein
MYHRTVKTFGEGAGLPGPDLRSTFQPTDAVEVSVAPDDGLSDDGLRPVRLSSDDYPTHSPIPATINRGGSAILATTPASGSTYRGGSILPQHEPKKHPRSRRAAAQHPGLRHGPTPDEPTRDVGLPAPVRHRIAAAAAPRERRERRTTNPSRAGPKADDDGPEPPRPPLAARHEWAIWAAQRSRELRELQEQDRLSTRRANPQLSLEEWAA